jgi:hypothetical protein
MDEWKRKVLDNVPERTQKNVAMNCFGSTSTIFEWRQWRNREILSMIDGCTAEILTISTSFIIKKLPSIGVI